MEGAFGRCHPAVNFLYFGAVLAFGMWFLHPVCLLISCGTALCWSILLKGRRAVRFALCGMLPLMGVTAVLSPLFSHEGATILWYFPDGNPLTLESIAYGCAAAAMLAGVILWFSCYNEVMTSDKFLYLFGRVIPALSLIFSMALRFVPRFQAQFRVVQNGQKCLGKLEGEGTFSRLRGAVRVLSIMVTWALENAIDTADSMKSRGYGLPGRTAFSRYRFGSRDALTLGALGAEILFLLAAALRGAFDFVYFPLMAAGGSGKLTCAAFLVYFLLCATPLILEGREAQLWNSIEWKS